MLTRRHLVVSMLALSAAGCAGQRQPMFQMRTSVEAHPLKNGTGVELLGIEAAHEAPSASGLNNTFYIWSLVRFREQTPRHELEVEHHYLGPEIAWSMAQDSQGNSLSFKPAVRKVTSCTTTQCTFIEIFSVVIADSTLRASQNAGYSVFIGSHAGRRKQITLSPAQIRAQLAACAAARG